MEVHGEQSGDLGAFLVDARGLQRLREGYLGTVRRNSVWHSSQRYQTIFSLRPGTIIVGFVALPHFEHRGVRSSWCRFACLSSLLSVTKGFRSVNGAHARQ